MHDAVIAYLSDTDDDTGLQELEVVRDGPLERVLERIAASEFSTLLVARLNAVAGSLRELTRLIDWLEDAGARLIALDINLDTGTPQGRKTIAALREVARWEHDHPPDRPPRGRPGLSLHDPKLTARITRMREREGASLEQIADALNTDGVPTPRGGTHWRPSSVQAALGYRRPPPGPPLPPSPRESEGPRGPKPKGPVKPALAHRDRPTPDRQRPQRPRRDKRP
ncbi:MAG: recombinase family protein [Solirubrobacteraceae bacterium]